MAWLLRWGGEPGVASGVEVPVVRIEVDVQTLNQSGAHLEDVAEPATQRFDGTPRSSVGEYTVSEALDDDAFALFDVVEVGNLVHDGGEQRPHVGEERRH